MPPDVVISRPRVDALYLHITSVPVTEVYLDPAWSTCNADADDGGCPRGSVHARVDVHTVPVTASVRRYIHSELLNVLDATEVCDDPVILISVVGPVRRYASVNEQRTCMTSF